MFQAHSIATAKQAVAVATDVSAMSKIDEKKAAVLQDHMDKLTTHVDRLTKDLQRAKNQEQDLQDKVRDLKAQLRRTKSTVVDPSELKNNTTKSLQKAMERANLTDTEKLRVSEIIDESSMFPSTLRTYFPATRTENIASGSSWEDYTARDIIYFNPETARLTCPHRASSCPESKLSLKDWTVRSIWGTDRQVIVVTRTVSCNICKANGDRKRNKVNDNDDSDDDDDDDDVEGDGDGACNVAVKGARHWSMIDAEFLSHQSETIQNMVTFTPTKHSGYTEELVHELLFVATKSSSNVTDFQSALVQRYTDRYQRAYESWLLHKKHLIHEYNSIHRSEYEEALDEWNKTAAENLNNPKFTPKPRPEPVQEPSKHAEDLKSMPPPLPTFMPPCVRQLQDCAESLLTVRKPSFDASMEQLRAKTLAVDHTFGTQVIATLRAEEDQHPVEGGFSLQNEKGQIVTAVFVPSTSMECVKECLKEFFSRVGQPQHVVCYADLCCENKHSWSYALPDGVVTIRKLDIQHYEDRFKRFVGIPNYHKKWYDQFLGELFGQLFDANGNLTRGEKYDRSVPAKEILEERFLAVFNKWKGKVDEHDNAPFWFTQESWCNLWERQLDHIRNDCISDPTDGSVHFLRAVGPDGIPNGKTMINRGTSGLEAYHAYLRCKTSNRNMGFSKLGLLLKGVVYHWNAEKHVNFCGGVNFGCGDIFLHRRLRRTMDTIINDDWIPLSKQVVNPFEKIFCASEASILQLEREHVENRYHLRFFNDYMATEKPPQAVVNKELADRKFSALSKQLGSILKIGYCLPQSYKDASKKEANLMMPTVEEQKTTDCVPLYRDKRRALVDNHGSVCADQLDHLHLALEASSFSKGQFKDGAHFLEDVYTAYKKTRHLKGVTHSDFLARFNDFFFIIFEYLTLQTQEIVLLLTEVDPAQPQLTRTPAMFLAPTLLADENFNSAGVQVHCFAFSPSVKKCQYLHMQTEVTLDESIVPIVTCDEVLTEDRIQIAKNVVVVDVDEEFEAEKRRREDEDAAQSDLKKKRKRQEQEETRSLVKMQQQKAKQVDLTFYTSAKAFALPGKTSTKQANQASSFVCPPDQVPFGKPANHWEAWVLFMCILNTFQQNPSRICVYWDEIKAMYAERVNINRDGTKKMDVNQRCNYSSTAIVRKIDDTKLKNTYGRFRKYWDSKYKASVYSSPKSVFEDIEKLLEKRKSDNGKEPKQKKVDKHSTKSKQK